MPLSFCFYELIKCIVYFFLNLKALKNQLSGDLKLKCRYGLFGLLLFVAVRLDFIYNTYALKAQSIQSQCLRKNDRSLFSSILLKSLAHVHLRHSRSEIVDDGLIQARRHALTTLSKPHRVIHRLEFRLIVKSIIQSIVLIEIIK